MFYGPSTHFRSFRARSVNRATLFLGKPPRQLPISLPITDNCPSWISGRERMVVEFFSLPNLNERMFCRAWGSNPRLSAYKADAHPIELPRPAVTSWYLFNATSVYCLYFNVIPRFVSSGVKQPCRQLVVPALCKEAQRKRLNLYVTHVTIAEYRKREPATAIIARKNFAKVVQMLTRVREWQGIMK